MSRRGFTFIELMIVVFVIGILAAVGISKYQSFVIETRQKACMSQQKALDQAFAVWETKNSPIPTDDGAFMFIHPSTGGPLVPGSADTAYRFRWDATAQAYTPATCIHNANAPETRSVLPSGSQLSRLVADEKLFCCPELNKRAGGAEFVPIPALVAGNAGNNPTDQTNNSVVSYQFYKAPTEGNVALAAVATSPCGAWCANNAALSNMENNYVPFKIRRAVVCRAYGMEHADGTVMGPATGTVGVAFQATTVGVPAETLSFINGAGPDGTREMLHQSFLLQ